MRSSQGTYGKHYSAKYLSIALWQNETPLLTTASRHSGLEGANISNSCRLVQ